MITFIRSMVLVTIGGMVTLPVLAQAPEEERPLSITLRQQFTHDSNFLRLPEGVDPRPLVGVSSRSDLISLTSARIGYNQQISGQRVAAYAELGANNFSNYTQFNNVSQDISARWDWQYGRQWYGLLDARRQEFLNSFANQQALQKNIIDSTLLGSTIGYRWTPRWSSFVRFEAFERGNSAQQLRPSDVETSAVELGAKYDTATGNSISAVIRQSDVRSPNRQVRDAAGNLLPVAVDNAATETRALLRMTLTPTGNSALNGEVGFTQRRFDNLSQRDFSGITANLTYRYVLSGSVVLNAAVRRDINNADFVFASFTDARVISAGASWQPTGKLIVRVNADHRRIGFDGDPGFIIGLTGLRRDTINGVSIGLDYEVLRRGLIYTQLRRDTRDSTFSGLDFVNTSLVIGAQVTF